MNFLEFAVWGAYLTCMGNYLGVAGLGDQIAWFYAIQGIVSIFMPTLMGIIADKYIQPQRVLGLCHLVAGAFMLGCWWLGLQAGFGQELESKGLFIALYTLSVAFYMPTIALANTTAFTILKKNGLDTVKDFPPIRVLGTVGFIITMWFVNCACWEDGTFTLTLAESAHKFQYTYMQFFVSGLLSLALFAYCFTLPECKLEPKKGVSLAESFGLSAFKLFKTRKMALFFIFSALLGMCLQVTNGYAGPFITSFKGSADAAIASSFAANNATLLTSISQMSEALCILMIPFFLKRYGIKVVMLMSMFAWVFRFRHARCDHVHPVMRRLWCRLRLLQCVGWYLRRSGVRAIGEGFCPGSVHDDDQWCGCNDRNALGRRDCEPLLQLARGIPPGRLDHLLVYLRHLRPDRRCIVRPGLPS